MSRDVVFDLGGVVFRWEPLVLLQQLFPQRMPDHASVRYWARGCLSRAGSRAA